MDALPFTAIKSQEQYKAYCDIREELNLLISTWEEAHPALLDADPVKLLGQLMKENKIKAADLAGELEISKTLLSDILHYRRRLSKKVIRKLASKFNVSQKSWNRPYDLVRTKAATKESGKPPDQRRIGSTKNQIGPAKVKQRPRIERKDTAIVEFLKSRTGQPTVAKLKNGRIITIWNMFCGYLMGDEYANITTNCRPEIPGAAMDFLFTSEIEEFIDPAADATSSPFQTPPNQNPSPAPSPNR
jgi:HTH-type transcriptional regulator/antitoxin HigA